MNFESELSFKWLSSQNASKVKDLSRLMQAGFLWNKENTYREKLLSLMDGNSWNNDIRDTARAASALALTGIVSPGTRKYILAGQNKGSWNQDVYDSTYAVAALADMGSFNEKGCSWLVDNYGKEWEHPGTTALVITALAKQEQLAMTGSFTDFMEERAEWLLSRKEKNSSWKTPATSNLVIQSLLINGYKDYCTDSLKWIISEMNNNGSWGKDSGDINTTSLSLITIKSFQNSY